MSSRLELLNKVKVNLEKYIKLTSNEKVTEALYKILRRVHEAELFLKEKEDATGKPLTAKAAGHYILKTYRMTQEPNFNRLLVKYIPKHYRKLSQLFTLLNKLSEDILSYDYKKLKRAEVDVRKIHPFLVKGENAFRTAASREKVEEKSRFMESIADEMKELISMIYLGKNVDKSIVTQKECVDRVSDLWNKIEGINWSEYVTDELHNPVYMLQETTDTFDKVFKNFIVKKFSVQRTPGEKKDKPHTLEEDVVHIKFDSSKRRPLTRRSKFAPSGGKKGIPPGRTLPRKKRPIRSQGPIHRPGIDEIQPGYSPVKTPGAPSKPPEVIKPIRPDKVKKEKVSPEPEPSSARPIATFSAKLISKDKEVAKKPETPPEKKVPPTQKAAPGPRSSPGKKQLTESPEKERPEVKTSGVGKKSAPVRESKKFVPPRAPTISPEESKSPVPSPTPPTPPEPSKKQAAEKKFAPSVKPSGLASAVEHKPPQQKTAIAEKEAEQRAAPAGGEVRSAPQNLHGKLPPGKKFTPAVDRIKMTPSAEKTAPSPPPVRGKKAEQVEKARQSEKPGKKQSIRPESIFRKVEKKAPKAAKPADKRGKPKRSFEEEVMGLLKKRKSADSTTQLPGGETKILREQELQKPRSFLSAAIKMEKPKTFLSSSDEPGEKPDQKKKKPPAPPSKRVSADASVTEMLPPIEFFASDVRDEKSEKESPQAADEEKGTSIADAIKMEEEEKKKKKKGCLPHFIGIGAIVLAAIIKIASMLIK